MSSNRFDLLSVLIAVAESKNFRQAAQKLGVTQPTISLKLRELEAMHSVALFSQEGKKKVLSRYGVQLYETARSGLHEMDQRLSQLSRSFTSAEHTPIRIAGRRELLEYLSLQKKFQGRMDLMPCTSIEATERVLNHLSDIAITHIVPNSSELLAKKILDSSARIIISKSLLRTLRASETSFASNKDFLMKTPCISYTPDGHLLKDYAKHFNFSFSDLNIKFVVSDWKIISELVVGQFGYALIPSYVNLNLKEVIGIDISPEILPTMKFYAVFEKTLKKIDAYKEFLFLL